MEHWKKKTSLFLASQAVTLFGSSLVQFALVWYVTKTTSSGVYVALMTVCAYVPQFVLSFFAGVWADRYSKKRLIIASDASIALFTAALMLLLPALLADIRALLPALLVISALRSAGTGIQTPAVAAVLPELAPKDKLMRVNGVNATLQSAVQFAAPAAAGAILSFGTLQSTLLIDILTAAVGIGLFSLIHVPKAAGRASGASVFSDMKLGFHYARKEGVLFRLLAMFGAFIFFSVPAGFLATLFVTREFGDSYLNMTLVEVVGFAGMALGGVLLSAWGGFKNRFWTLLSGMAAFGALAITMGAARSLWLYLAMMLVYGVALTMVQTSTTTILQERAAPEMQGRMFGFMNAMFSGFLPLGMALFGPLSDAVPIRAVMMLSGGAQIALAGLGVLLFKQQKKAD